MSPDTPPMDDKDEHIRQLDQRVEQLEGTIKKMLPSRRDALKLGGAAVIGGAAMSGSASAGSSQVGTIGSPGSPVDVQAEDIDASDTITTQDLVVNGTATGPFGGGGIVLEAGDSITVATLANVTTELSFVTLYNGTAKDVLGGIMAGHEKLDFLYTFADGSTIRKNGSGTSYSAANDSGHEDQGGEETETDFLPPAKNVTKIEVGGDQISGATQMGAEVLLKD